MPSKDKNLPQQTVGAQSIDAQSIDAQSIDAQAVCAHSIDPQHRRMLQKQEDDSNPMAGPIVPVTPAPAIRPGPTRTIDIPGGGSLEVTITRPPVDPDAGMLREARDAAREGRAAAVEARDAALEARALAASLSKEGVRAKAMAAENAKLKATLESVVSGLDASEARAGAARAKAEAAEGKLEGCHQDIVAMQTENAVLNTKLAAAEQARDEALARAGFCDDQLRLLQQQYHALFGEVSAYRHQAHREPHEPRHEPHEPRREPHEEDGEWRQGDDEPGLRRLVDDLRRDLQDCECALEDCRRRAAHDVGRLRRDLEEEAEENRQRERQYTACANKAKKRASEAEEKLQKTRAELLQLRLASERAAADVAKDNSPAGPSEESELAAARLEAEKCAAESAASVRDLAKARSELAGVRKSLAEVTEQMLRLVRSLAGSERGRAELDKVPEIAKVAEAMIASVKRGAEGEAAPPAAKKRT